MVPWSNDTGSEFYPGLRGKGILTEPKEKWLSDEDFINHIVKVPTPLRGGPLADQG